MDHTKSYSRRLLMKGKLQTSSRPRLSGKVAASAVERGKLEQTRQKVSYRTVLNTCLSFLNEVMASEPLFEEQSDAVKVSETLYPTNGSGKNLAKDTGIKCSDLCTHPCPFRLALLGTSLRIRGKRTLRKKEFIVFIFYIRKPKTATLSFEWRSLISGN